MKLMKNKKNIGSKKFTKGTYTHNYSRFYLEGQQELCPFLHVTFLY